MTYLSKTTQGSHDSGKGKEERFGHFGHPSPLQNPSCCHSLPAFSALCFASPGCKLPVQCSAFNRCGGRLQITTFTIHKGWSHQHPPGQGEQPCSWPPAPTSALHSRARPQHHYLIIKSLFPQLEGFCYKQGFSLTIIALGGGQSSAITQGFVLCAGSESLCLSSGVPTMQA